MATPAIGQQYLDATTILTLAGSTVAVTTISLFIRRLLGVSSVWIPALLSIGLSLAIAQQSGWPANTLGWIVVFVNGCTLFFACIGQNESLVPREVGQGTRQGRLKRWFGSFFKGRPTDD